MSAYRVGPGGVVVGEAALGLYLVTCAAFAAARGAPVGALLLCALALGALALSVASIAAARQGRSAGK